MQLSKKLEVACSSAPPEIGIIRGTDYTTLVQSSIVIRQFFLAFPPRTSTLDPLEPIESRRASECLRKGKMLMLIFLRGPLVSGPKGRQ